MFKNQVLSLLEQIIFFSDKVLDSFPLSLYSCESYNYTIIMQVRDGINIIGMYVVGVSF